MFQRQAKGKLVECGECGNLIPEDATVCPKCGAEFETDLVRCSRCGSTIPANSQVCPECAAQLLGKGEQETSDPERQGYADFVERFRAGARKELGDNYNEGAFWDWWKRQATYLPFSQWKFQQTQGSRAGMTAPPADSSGDNMAVAAEQLAPAAPATPPKKGGGPGLGSAPGGKPAAREGREHDDAPADAAPGRPGGGNSARGRGSPRDVGGGPVGPDEGVLELRQGDPARVPRLSVLRRRHAVGPPPPADQPF